jgi:predicted RND superfamily exporter protein
VSRSIENAMGSALARLVGAVQRRPAAVLLACLAATALVAAYTATHLGVNADQDAMLSEDLPHRVFEIKYHEHFPVLYENVVVVVDATSSERARVAARALASRMEAAPELFHDVYLPLNPFFEQNALLFLDTDQLQDLADRLARVQPYLSGLAKDGTLRGLTMMLARGLRAAREGDVGGEQLLPMFERLAAALEARLRGEDYTLSWAEIVAQGDLALDPNRRFIIAQPVLDFSNIAAAEKPLEAVKRFARAQGLTEENGVRVRTTGDVALSYEEMELVKGQAATAGLASFVAVAALLFLALRSARLVLATTFTLVIGLIWTAGFAAAAIGHLNLISVAFAVLFIGLGVDFGVHLCLRYQELLGQGREHAVALTETARGVGGSARSRPPSASTPSSPPTSPAWPSWV